MKVNADPRKLWLLRKGVRRQIIVIPNRIMRMNWDGFPRKSPSSSCRQCRTRKYMLNMKSTENRPKNRKGENRRHICPSNMSSVL